MYTIPRIFIAYSREDEMLLSKLRTHLTPLERSGKVEIWYDGKIEPGVVWENAIKEELHSADIILMLVSASAIASDYFYDKELKNALKRHQSGEARVVPLILRPCAWMATPLGELQALPKDGLAVTSWPDQDAAFSDAVNSLWEMIKNLHAQELEAAKKIAEQERLAKKAASQKEELQRQKESETQRKQAAAAEALRQRKLAEEKQKEVLAEKERQAAERAEKREALKNRVSATLQHPGFWGSAILIIVVFVIFKACSGKDDFQVKEDTNLSDTTMIVEPLIEASDPKAEYGTLLREAQNLLENKKYEAAKTRFEKALNFTGVHQLNDKEAERGLKDCNLALKKIAEGEKDQSAWDTARKENTIASYKKYLNAYPDGNYKKEAEKRLLTLSPDSFDASFMHSNGKSYCFKGSNLFIFTPGKGLDEGCPLRIADHWKGLPRDFQSGIDAAFMNHSGNKIYFFKGANYIRLTPGRGMDGGYPLPISPQHWKGLPRDFQSGINAVFMNQSSNKIYFFKGSKFLRFTVGKGMDEGYPLPISTQHWKRMSQGFQQDIDAVIMHSNGKIYFFKGLNYVRFSPDKGMDGGYPLLIQDHWRG